MMRSTLLILLLLVLTQTQIRAQDNRGWDYDEYPRIPFILKSIDLKMDLSSPASAIQGEAVYTLEARIPGLSSLTFNSGRLSVTEITADGNELEFSVSGDSLFIQLNDTLDNKEVTDFRIAWSASSVYAFNMDYMDNFWSSLNPKSVRQWIPVPDHPEAESPLNASFTVPAGEEVVFNGQRVSDEVQSAETKTITWNTENPVPLTGLSFATGNFIREEALSGIKKVSLFTTEGLLMEEVREGLLRNAVNELKKAESELSFEYPYESLNIVILPEHKWEEVQAGAGIVYLYQDLGSLDNQLKRAVSAQWMGNYLRFRTSEGALVKAEFLKSRLLSAEKDLTIKNPDMLQSLQAWNASVSLSDSVQNSFYIETVDMNIGNIIRSNKGVYEWEDYAAGWYKQTGVYWEILPFPVIKEAEKSAPAIADTVTVNTGFDEMSSALTVYFKSGNGAVDSLLNINARVYAFDDTSDSRFTFTGTSDTSRAELPQTTEYIVFEQPEQDHTYLKVERLPLSFLLNMLRSANAEHRILGSRGLQYHADNPDLQLALRDILSSESNPEVKAEIYTTLAAITAGATGTEQTFLELLNNEPLPVKLAALKALGNYPGNEQVLYTTESVILNAQETEVFKEALETYTQIGSDSALVDLSDKLNRRDKDAALQLLVLEKSMQADDSGSTLQLADALTAAEYPYPIRRKALNLLIKYDTSEAYWTAKISQLSSDTDPRIRRDVLGATVHLSASAKNDVIDSVMSEEEDPRVRNYAEKMRQTSGTTNPGMVN